MDNRIISRFSVGFAVFVVLFGGCSRDHLDPTQIGRFRPIPTVNVILDSLGVAEEASPMYENAEEPRPADIVAHESDYIFGSGDTIRVIIYELLQENATYVNDFQVNESGNISVPEIGHVQAAGLTELELEDEIAELLSPTILKNPSVTITLQQSQSRLFSILGDGVAKPNRYGIPRYDFRLMDALAVAGSARQHNVSYIYIIRQITGEEDSLPEQMSTAFPAKEIEPQKEQTDIKLELKPIEPLPRVIEPDSTEDEMFEIIAPYTKNRGEQAGIVMTSSEMITARELESLVSPDGFEATAAVEEASATMPESISQRSPESETINVLAKSKADSGNVEWIFENGTWVPVYTGKEIAQDRFEDVGVEPSGPEARREVYDDSYGWEQIDTAGVQTRVIRVPTDKLFGSDPRYNVVIKPGDTISVRLDIVGEFYVHGNVNRVGVYNLTGRPMTLKMAIATAGGLGPLAWPKKCEVVRRVEEKKEEIVMVDLEKISNGTQPDFFIKQNDWINVGTHGTSRWLAVLRNAFRASYGFGFIYDRNFSDKDFRDIGGDILGFGL